MSGNGCRVQKIICLRTRFAKSPTLEVFQNFRGKRLCLKRSFDHEEAKQGDRSPTKIKSSDDSVGKPLVVVELPLPVVVIALSNQLQAEGDRLTFVQVWHQALAEREQTKKTKVMRGGQRQK